MVLQITRDDANSWTPEGGFNTNALDPAKFKIIFTRIPNYVFFCQAVTLPALNLGIAPRPSQMIDYTEVGEKIDFGNLTIQMILDSRLDNYKALFSWMKDLSVIGKGVGTTSNAILTLGDGNDIEFVNIWPSNIGSILFTSLQDVVQYAISDVTFNFDYFHFPDIDKLKIV